MADRPVVAVTVARGGFEVQIAQPVGCPAPVQRASAHDARAHPAKRLTGGRGEGVIRAFSKRQRQTAVAALAKRAPLAAHAQAPARIIGWMGSVMHEVPAWLGHGTGIEHQHFHALRG